jgi:hypothetical protein
LAVGLVGLLGTQAYAAFRLSSRAQDAQGNEFKLFPPRSWRRIYKELPATCWLVHLAAWSLTFAACAIVIIGNLFYWVQGVQPREYADHSLRKAAEARELDKDLGDQNPFRPGLPKTQLPTTDSKQDTRPTVQCAIIGYVPDERGVPTTLVLARVNEGKLVYCGIVKRGFLPEELEELREVLSKTVRAQPLIKGLQQEAVWVRAGAFCDVHQSGIDAAGLLIEPSFGRIRK